MNNHQPSVILYFICVIYKMFKFPSFKTSPSSPKVEISLTCPYSDKEPLPIDATPEFLADCADKRKLEKSIIQGSIKSFSNEHNKFMKEIDANLKQFPNDENLKSKRLGYDQNNAILSVNAIGTFLTTNAGKPVKFSDVFNAATNKTSSGQYIALLNKLNKSEKELLKAFLNIKTQEGLEYLIKTLGESNTVGLKIQEDSRFKHNLERFVKLPKDVQTELLRMTLSYGGKKKLSRRIKKTRKLKKTRKQKKTRNCKKR